MIKKNDFTFHALFIVLIITFIAYYPCINNDLTTWDDAGYVTQNPRLKQNSVADYFLKDKFVMGNYHPFTMVSYAIEYAFVTIEPKQYHIDNRILHLLNTALVFWLIFLLAGWQIAAVVAVLFGVHPMHVESVAWVSERKDVLYSFFYLSSIVVYIYYLKNERKFFYIATFLLFLFSLLSKGQAVTLPITLLLIDYFYDRKISRKLIYEKIPFFLFSIVFGIIAVIAQQSANIFHSRMATINEIVVAHIGFFDKFVHFFYKIFERICYASYGLLAYIFKLLIPTNLSCFYPYPQKTDGLLPVIFYIAPIFLVLLIVLIYSKWRKNKNSVFGSLFFVVNIVPLLQLLPVGSAIFSDRYCYIPSIGYFFMVVHLLVYFSGYEIIDRKLVASNQLKQVSLLRKISLTMVLFAITIYAYAGNQRCKVWKDTETLFTNVVENYPNVSIFKICWVKYILTGEIILNNTSPILQSNFIKKPFSISYNLFN